MPTIGALSFVPPVPPRNTASPKANTPPSAATSQFPAPVAVGAVGLPPVSGRAAAAGIAAGSTAATARTTDSQRENRRVPRIVVPDTLSVGFAPQKRGGTVSNL